MAGSIFIPLISVFDAKGIRDAKSGMTALAGVVKNLKGAAIAAAAAFAAVGAANFVKESVVAARDLDRNMVGLGNVFEGLTPQMKQFAKDASAIGLSQVEASRASTFLGSVLKQSGFEMGDVAVETKNLVGLASDLAATYGYDVSEALTGMTALFRGEYDPIEKFGVAMKQSEVNALLAARGQNKLTGAALRNATAQARLDILYNRSVDAQASYAQQSDSLFVAQKNLAASFENIKASLGASLTGPLGALLQAMQPIIESAGMKLAPIFGILAEVVTMLSPVMVAMAEQFLVVADAITPILDVLFMLIEPLMIPLAGVFQLLASIITPFIPLITFLANVFGAILAPVVWAVTMSLRILTEGLKLLFDSLAKIPLLGNMFKGINEGLKDFSERVLDSTGKTDSLGGSANAMTSILSKKLPLNNIDGLGNAAAKATKKVNGTNGALSELLKNALEIQKSIIESANINNLLDKNADEVVESITYLNGKFKTVAFGATKGANNIADAFKNNLNKIKDFYKNLQALSKAGLDDNLISQIVSAGPEAGNATAEAILESGEKGISSLNKTAKDIKKYAGNIGYVGAYAMQNAGSKIGNGLIDGLYAMEASMLAAAKTVGTSVGDTLASAATAKLKTVIADAGAAGFQLTLEEKLAIDPNYKPEPYVPPKKVIPTGNALPVFVSTFKAGTAGAGLEGGFKLMESEDIINPFDSKTNSKGFRTFHTNQQKANEYNISINVAPGASGPQIGQALVNAIQEYERVKGKGWRG